MNKDAAPRPPDVTRPTSTPSLLRIRLGMELQDRRIAHGLTQIQLAKRVGISLKYLGEIERGEANSTLDVIERIAGALNVDPMSVFEGLREPVTEGIRVLLINQLRAVNQILTQAILWLEALAPGLNRTVLPSSGADAVGTVTGDEQSNAGKPRRRWRLPGVTP